MNKKKHKKKKHFLHWLRTDFGRVVVSVVGDENSAAVEIKRYFGNDSAAVVDALRNEASDFWKDAAKETKAMEKCGRVLGIDSCLSVMWFPVIPADGCLVHEFLHCVQIMDQGTGIRDDEYDAYMLETLFEFFKEKMDADAKIGLEGRK